MNDVDGRSVECIKLVECPICLDVIDNTDVSVITVKCCNNKFHSMCHAHCVAVKNECPLCRACQCMRTPTGLPCISGIPSVLAGPDVPHLVGIPHNPDIPHIMIHMQPGVRGNVRHIVRRRTYLLCVVSVVAYCGMWFIG